MAGRHRGIAGCDLFAVFEGADGAFSLRTVRGLTDHYHGDTDQTTQQHRTGKNGTHRVSAQKLSAAYHRKNDREREYLQLTYFVFRCRFGPNQYERKPALFMQSRVAGAFTMKRCWREVLFAAESVA